MGPDLANVESERVGPPNEVFICVWGFFFFPLLREFSSTGFYFLCVLGKKCPSPREM